MVPVAIWEVSSRCMAVSSTMKSIHTVWAKHFHAAHGKVRNRSLLYDNTTDRLVTLVAIAILLGQPAIHIRLCNRKMNSMCYNEVAEKIR